MASAAKNRPGSILLALAGAAVFLPACGESVGEGPDAAAVVDCSLITDVDSYSPGMEKTGAAGYHIQLMDSNPAPPRRGDNVWVVKVSDDASAPMDGLGIRIRTWMPEHQHGSPIMPQVSPTGSAGEYELDPVNLFMPGVWEITVKVLDSGDAQLDEVLYTFCVEP